MPVYRIEDFPCVVFGEDSLEQARKVRMLFSPELGNETVMTLVTVVLPPKSVSDVHVHEENDEYMYFDKDGFAIIDGMRYEVPARSIVHAPKGSRHAGGNDSVTESINLLCIFIPGLKPYGKYFELIEKTKRYLNEL